jgi:integrase
MNKYKYNINFRLEKRKIKGEEKLFDKNLQILADITFNHKRLFYFIGYRIDESKWTDKSESGEKIQRVRRNNFNERGESTTIINGKINEVEFAIKSIFQKLEVENKIPTVELVRAELKSILNEELQKPAKSASLWDAFQLYIDTAKVSEGRRKHLTSTQNHLKRFESQLGFSITFERFDSGLIHRFEAYLKEEGTDPEKYKHLPKKDRPKRKSGNRITGVLKILRAFFNWASSKSQQLIKTSPFENFQIDVERYGRPIYLTKKERDHLYDFQTDNEKLKKVRDIFVFQCYVGCRVGDLIKLTKGNIINGSVEYIPGKTKEELPIVVRVPLTVKAKEILSRYNIPDGSLLPFISDQRYNEYLKELFEEAKLNRMVTRLNPLTRNEERVPLYSIATSHMARRTFVGTLHRNVKDSVIASMSGHVEDSRAFSRYYNVDDDTKADAVNNFLD